MEGFTEEPPIVAENEEHGPIPEYMRMYEISGQDAITERSFKRYLDDKKAEPRIQDVAKDSPAKQEKEIDSVDIYHKALAIEKGLASRNLESRKVAASKISSARDWERASLMEKAFATGNIEIQQMAAFNIQYLDEGQRSLFQTKAAEIIEAGFSGGDPNVQKSCAEMIPCVSPDKMRHLVEKGVAAGDIEARMASVTAIESVPKDEKEALITRCLDSGDIELQAKCVDTVWVVSDASEARLNEKLAAIIKNGLDVNDANVQIAYAKMLWKIPWPDRIEFEEKKLALMEQGLASSDPALQKAWAPMIAKAPRENIPALINLGLASGNAEVQKICIGTIRATTDGDARQELQAKIPALILRGLSEGDIEARKIYASMIESAPQDEQKRLFEAAKDALGDALVEPPLYKNAGLSEEVFSRAEFEKTGSKTILLGGDVHGKTIVRRIEPEAFLAWEGLYENHELWRDEGFDYVPVEPIQAFKLNKQNLVDVYSGVLDLSYGSWKNMEGDYTEELEQDRRKILGVLEKIGFVHGHEHINNFCLRFFRDASGKVDFNRKPRIYLIDFDRAVSPTPAN